MRLRLRALEQSIRAVAHAVEHRDTVAAYTEQAWRMEYAATLDMEHVIKVARGIHEGDGDVFADYRRIAEAEAAHVAARRAAMMTGDGPPPVQAR